MNIGIVEFVQTALAEDVGRGDLFERTIEPAFFEARIISKSSGVFAGERYVEALFKLYHIEYTFLVHDGSKILPSQPLVVLKGLNTDILKIERTVLNMLQHASGIATKASLFAELAKRYDVCVLDTRKTRPNLRVFEKYAARAGGITNHRFGLDDALMIKDTHRKAIGDLASYLQNVRKKIPFTATVEIECENEEAAYEAMRLGADIIMCDNMNAESVQRIVRYKNETYPRVLIECSGGIDETNFVEYAQTKTDAISIGAVIHHADWLDFSMKGV